MTRTTKTLGAAGKHRRTAILDAAERLFPRSGYEEVSMEDLAEAAGVTAPALYRYFSGKAHVHAEMYARALEREVDAVLAAAVTPRGDKLRALAEAIADSALATASLTTAWMRHAASSTVADRAGLNRRLDEVRHRLAVVLQSTRPDLDAVTARHMIDLVQGMCGAAAGLVRRDEGEADDVRRLLGEMILASFHVPPGRRQ